ncbi:MAG: phasin family protein [Pikeienuella sp.]
MFNADNNPFDPAKMTEMMKSADFTKMFDLSQFKGLDQSALFDAQKKNMDALVAAQQAAAAGYQDLFQKQVTIFQDTISAAQAQVAELSASGSPTDAAAKQADLSKKAYETALANVNELTEAAQKANAEAFEIVKARVEASVKELQTLA